MDPCVRSANVRWPLVVALAAATALAAAAPSARAGGLLDRVLAPCPGQELTQPFLPWNDQARYTLVPNGDFESGASSWTTAAETALVPENESFGVGGADDAASLGLA